MRRLAVVAAGLAVLALLWALFQPFAGHGGEAVRVTIPKQAGVGRIGDILDQRGVVPSSMPASWFASQAAPSPS